MRGQPRSKTKSQDHRLNRWLAQPLKGAPTGLAPIRGTESLTPHYHLRQPLTCGCLFCLTVLATRKRVGIFLDACLILCVIFFQLIPNVLRYHFAILSHRIYEVPSAPEIPAPVLVFQIGVPVKDHQTAFSLEISHKLCYTDVRRHTYQHMDMIRAGFCFDDFCPFLFTQLSKYLAYIFSQFPVYFFPSVLWGENNVILAPVLGMC